MYVKKRKKKIKEYNFKKKNEKVQLQKKLKKITKNTATKKEWPKKGVGERGGGAHRKKLSSVFA